MSRENVDLARRGNEAFNRGDLDAWLAYADPDIRIRSSFTGREFHGLDGAREWWEDVRSTFSDFTIQLEELRGAGNFVLAHASIRGHGSDSSAPFEQQVWVVTEYSNGKCIASLAFLSEAEALEAAGLQE
jgi:ketosteroid isomerase-like protein